MVDTSKNISIVTLINVNRKSKNIRIPFLYGQL
jgi:hypothetical protein